MTKPIIGITCHTVPGTLERSSVVQAYVDAIQHTGGAPLLIPIGLDPDGMRAIYSALDGLLLPGGIDVSPDRYHQERHAMLGEVDPMRDELEITLAAWAVEDDLPVLGICRGIQVLAVAAGGSLFQDLPSERTSEVAHEVREFGRDFLSHRIDVECNSRLGRALGCASSQVNSFHHQAVRDVPPGFVVTALSEDGVIEGIEATDRQFIVGVQCHPEAMWNTTAPEYLGLFAAFVDAAAHHARSQRPGEPEMQIAV